MSKDFQAQYLGTAPPTITLELPLPGSWAHDDLLTVFDKDKREVLHARLMESRPGGETLRILGGRIVRHPMGSRIPRAALWLTEDGRTYRVTREIEAFREQANELIADVTTTLNSLKYARGQYNRRARTWALFDSQGAFQINAMSAQIIGWTPVKVEKLSPVLLPHPMNEEEL